jgi:hypothetical protein
MVLSVPASTASNPVSVSSWAAACLASGSLLREVVRESADVCRPVQNQDLQEFQARGLRQGTQQRRLQYPGEFICDGQPLCVHDVPSSTRIPQ